jgi:hypothetical protein
MNLPQARPLVSFFFHKNIHIYMHWFKLWYKLAHTLMIGYTLMIGLHHGTYTRTNRYVSGTYLGVFNWGVIESTTLGLLCASVPILVVLTAVIVKYAKYIPCWIVMASFGFWIVVMATVLWFGLQYWKYIHMLAGCVGSAMRGTDEDIEGVFRAGMAIGTLICLGAIVWRLMWGKDSHKILLGGKRAMLLPACCACEPTPPTENFSQSLRRNGGVILLVNSWCIMCILMCVGAAGVWTARTNEDYDKYDLVMAGRVAAERAKVPIFVGEFGTDDANAPWFQHAVEYMRRHNLHWAYWALDGQKVSYVCMSVCMYGYIHIYIYICIYICMYVYIYIYIYIYIHVYTQTHTHTYTCTYMHAYVYIIYYAHVKAKKPLHDTNDKKNESVHGISASLL